MIATEISAVNNERTGGGWRHQAKQFWFKLACHPVLLSIVFYCAAMLVVYVASQYQLNQSLQKLARQNTESVVSFVADTIQILNKIAWEREESTAFILPPISGKDQIESIIIVNALGGIIYPESRIYDILEDDRLEGVLRDDGKPVYHTNSPQSGSYYQPVFVNKVLKGAIVLNYKTPVSNAGILYVVLNKNVLLLMLAALLLAILMVWLILLPWKTLISVVEECVKTGEDIELNCGKYPQLNKMIKLIRLLLLRRD